MTLVFEFAYNEFVEKTQTQKSFYFKIFIIVFLLLLSFGSGIFLILYQNKPLKTAEPPRNRPLDTSDFSPTGYIQPLDKNATTKSIYSSRAQIRGQVVSVTNQVMKVQVGKKQLDIKLPSQVSLKCVPLTFTSPDGKTTYPADKIFMDFRNLTAQDKGRLITPQEVVQKFPAQSQITLQVNVDDKDRMEAYFLVGYGCIE